MRELLLAALNAFTFGVLFDLFFSFLAVIWRQKSNIVICAKKATSISKISINGLKEKIKREFKDCKSHGGALTVFISTILFTLGFIILSYYALDGEIRAYMLIFALGGLLLSKAGISPYTVHFLELLFSTLILNFTLILRLLLFPLLAIIGLILKKIPFFRKKVEF